jgi:gamma-glutamyltranspeptidase/glutathione hydrolase
LVKTVLMAMTPKVNSTSILAGSLRLLVSFVWPQATQTPVTAKGPSVAAGSQGVVVSGKPATTAAGIKILEEGGNAADAEAASLQAL